ncbi:MAG: peroxiredoxin [Pseudomonadota bacterium]
MATDSAAWICAALLAFLPLSTARAAPLAPGQPAPDFALRDQHGQVQRLADQRGHWVVLYFYPKDDTPGCTREACRFRDDLHALRALGAVVLGVSLDDSDSHARFAAKHQLPFPLLADPGGNTARAYASLWSLGPIKFAKRRSFLIDPAGRLARIYRKVAPDRHSQEIIADLRALQQGHAPRP